MKFRNTTRAYITICLIVLVISLLAACATPETTTLPVSKPVADGKPIYGGTLRFGNSTDARSLGYSPIQSTPADLSQGRTTMEPLVVYDKDGVLQPWLATGWKFDSQAKTVILTLRKGVKFHDGTDFNAEACKWNLELHMQEKKSEVAPINTIDVIDDYTVKLNLKTWDNTIIDNIAISVLMMSPAAYKTNGKDWCFANPVGTGPFQLVSWLKDNKQVYKKFAGYWQQGKPYLDTLEHVIIADPLVQVASIQRGDIDILQVVPLESVTILKAAGFISGVRGGTSQMAMLSDSQHADSPFADIRVRQAISYAVDSKAIVDSVLLGNGVVTNQWGPSGNQAYNPAVKGYPYNPEKAKQLLKDAGYGNGLKCILYGDNPAQNQQVAQAVQGFLSKVGINAELVISDPSKFMTYVSNGWTNGIMLTTLRSSAEYVSVMKRTLGTGSSVYSKGIMHAPEIDAQFDQAVTVTDLEAKKKILWEIQRLVYDQYCIVNPLWSNIVPGAYNKKAHDFGAFESIYSFGWTPHNAWMEK